MNGPRSRGPEITQHGGSWHLRPCEYCLTDHAADVNGYGMDRGFESSVTFDPWPRERSFRLSAVGAVRRAPARLYVLSQVTGYLVLTCDPHRDIGRTCQAVISQIHDWIEQDEKKKKTKATWAHVLENCALSGGTRSKPLQSAAATRSDFGSPRPITSTKCWYRNNESRLP
jgi:hypothetical protein